MEKTYLISELFTVKDRAGQAITPPRELLNILARRHFKQLLANTLKPYLLSLKENAPTVFISYAWALEGNPTYQQDKLYEGYVEKLAKDLERAGCKVFLDRWFDKAGKPLASFLELMGQADALIPVGTKLYRYKYEKRAQLANQSEHVVRAEGQILNYIATYSDAWREKIKPVLLEGTAQDCLPFLVTPNIPVFLHTSEYFEGLFKLLSAIFGVAHNDAFFNEQKKQFFATLKTLKQQPLAEHQAAYQQQQAAHQQTQTARQQQIVTNLLQDLLGNKGSKPVTTMPHNTNTAASSEATSDIRLSDNKPSP